MAYPDGVTHSALDRHLGGLTDLPDDWDGDLTDVYSMALKIRDGLTDLIKAADGRAAKARGCGMADHLSDLIDRIAEARDAAEAVMATADEWASEAECGPDPYDEWCDDQMMAEEGV